MEKQIGEAAGKIWQALHAGGPMSKPQLARATGLPAGAVDQGIGWLAREGKIVVDEKTQSLKLKK